jgi:zinc finger MYND domain-containing protein 10
MRLYFILYHEATLVNLLEVFLYYRHACEAGGEKMLELVDYVGRKLARLNNTGAEFRQQDQEDNDVGTTAESAKAFAERLQARSPAEELQRHFREIEFRVCISAVSISRFISEHADAMPLSVVSRITDTHDFLLLFIPLIENPPWTRRLSSSGKWQKLIDHKWNEVKPIDLLKITKLEGQPWLAVYYLLAKEVFRERYHLNSFRKSQLLRVRKYINDLTLDQLPFLADIQRYMDELAVTEVPAPTSLNTNGVFMFQQVAVMREAITKGKKWPDVAQVQVESVFTMTDKNDRDLMAMADLYSDDMSESVLDNEPSL